MMSTKWPGLKTKTPIKMVLIPRESSRRARHVWMNISVKCIVWFLPLHWGILDANAGFFSALNCVFVASLALQFVSVRPHGCVRQSSRLRPRNFDRLQGQQPEPCRPTLHTAQLVSRVTVWHIRPQASLFLKWRNNTNKWHNANITKVWSNLTLFYILRDTACLALCL